MTSCVKYMLFYHNKKSFKSILWNFKEIILFIFLFVGNHKGRPYHINKTFLYKNETALLLQGSQCIKKHMVS